MEAVELENPSPPPEMDDSCCSTPYVSAPSSPTRAAATTTTTTTGFYYSAPASPMHFLLSTNATLNNSSSSAAAAAAADSFDFDFDFSAPKFSSASADELFSNGQIRPMKLLSPLLESNDDLVDEPRGREMKQRAGSLRRRTRSMSPPRHDTSKEQNNVVLEEAAPCASRSRRWVFLKELLYRSKSEGRNDGHDHHRSSKFWFSPVKKTTPAPKAKGGGKRRSAHEVHYAAKRAEAEEMRKKTFLPYRQGLFGCLGFSSKSYGAMSNGLARALNPVSSR